MIADSMKIFLLGGHDLEMETIGHALRKSGMRFFDKHLMWGNACISQYKQELQEYGRRPECLIYGVELREDIECPCNYIRIDHHNDYVGRPSSLEQIMEILNIPMDRYQMLVAANDAYYIPGMIVKGATRDEIQFIRYADRKAQGVTEDDERLAVEAIAGKTEYGSLTVVHALSPVFSPICDRLYPYENLLVYTADEIVFYGKSVMRLRTVFDKYINEQKMYYGGGENGYIGMAKGVFSTDEINGLINRIKEIII